MQGSSNTSFIPKRNPNKKEATVGKRQVFVGTFLIRILFFAILIATAGVYIYEKNLQLNLESEIASLDSAISSFNETDLKRVLGVEERLSQANQRLMHSVSIASILTAVERSTIGSNQINQFSLERVNDNTIEIESDMQTGTFDSVLFQRDVFENSDTLVVSEIKDVVLQNVPPKNSLYEGQASGEQEEASVMFKASLTIDVEKVPHQVTPFDQFETQSVPTVSPVEPNIVPVDTQEAGVDEESNQEII